MVRFLQIAAIALFFSAFIVEAKSPTLVIPKDLFGCREALLDLWVAEQARLRPVPRSENIALSDIEREYSVAFNLRNKIRVETNGTIDHLNQRLFEHLTKDEWISLIDFLYSLKTQVRYEFFWALKDLKNWKQIADQTIRNFQYNDRSSLFREDEAILWDREGTIRRWETFLKTFPQKFPHLDIKPHDASGTRRHRDDKFYLAPYISIRPTIPLHDVSRPRTSLYPEYPMQAEHLLEEFGLSQNQRDRDFLRWGVSPLLKLKPEQRAKYTLSFSNGRIFNWAGIPLTTEGELGRNGHPRTPEGEKEVVLLREGEKTRWLISKVPGQEGVRFHSQLVPSELKGKVIFAGMLRAKDGKFLGLNRNSGHWKPSIEMELNAIEDLERNGVFDRELDYDKIVFDFEDRSVAP